MSYKVIATNKFKKDIKKLSKKYLSLKDDFAELITKLETNPTLGKSLGNNCYKIRLAITSKSKGKSGGARVLTYVHIIESTVYLLTIYDKSAIDTITDKELKSLLNLLF